MEAKIDDGEIDFLNDPPWLITNKRICYPHGVIRLSDVQGVEVISAKEKKSINADRTPYILFILAVIVDFYFWLPPLGQILSFIPAVIFWLIAGKVFYTTKLIAHCASGDFVLWEFEWARYEDSNGELLGLSQKTIRKEIWELKNADESKLKAIQSAIGKAMVESTSTPPLQSPVRQV